MAEDDPSPQRISDLEQRIDLLERENQRLRRKLDPMLGPDNPAFDVQAFLRVMRRTTLLAMIPLWLGLAVLPLAMVPVVGRTLRAIRIGPLPLVSLGMQGGRQPGPAVGVFALGGLAVGVVAVGGMSVGVIAVGGGALGVFAVGGGSVGLIALGGGACGYIAVGGGACGWYAMGRRGAGKFVLAINRQDPQAIALFGRWIPGLRAAVTMPMPVIPLKGAKRQ